METQEMFEFGPYRLIPSERLLLRQGEAVTLTPKAFDLLVALVENPGRLMAREDLLKTLWPESFVEENNLTVNVSTLRKVLGEGPDGPKYIETVPKKGYRFVAEVRLVTAGVEAASPLEPSAALPAKPRRPLRWAGLAAAFVLAVTALWYIARFGRDAKPVLRVTPLTSYPGFEWLPTISPDGARVAFVWTRRGTSPGIYVKPIGQGDPIRVTDEGINANSPAWSPNGEQIAFVSFESEVKSRILLVSAVGGGPARKLADSFQFTGMRGPYLAWSPDGRWLLVSETESGDGPLRISVISVETGQRRRQLTFPPARTVGDVQPSLSHDGRTLLFSRNITTTAGDLYTVEVSPEDLAPIGEPRRMTVNAGQMGGAAWTPDDREIIFSAGAPYGMVNLFRIPRKAGFRPAAPEPLAALGSDAVAPVISRPNERLPARLIYERFTYQTNLWRLNLHKDKTAPDPATPWAASTRVEQTPDFSADGSKVAFASNRSGSWEIWTCASSGTNCVQLTNLGSSYSRSPRWSPDARQLVFDSRIDGNADLYMIGADGGKPRRLTTEPSNEVAPCWSRDGRFLYFSSNRTGRYEVWKMPAASGPAVQMTRDGGNFPLQSPDGEWIYYLRSLPERGAVWKMPAGGGAEQPVASGIAIYRFAVSRTGLYYVGNEGSDHWRLDYLSLTTGKSVTLSRRGGLDQNGLAVAPDESWLLCVQTPENNSDLMLVDNFH